MILFWLFVFWLVTLLGVIFSFFGVEAVLPWPAHVAIFVALTLVLIWRTAGRRRPHSPGS